jgi:hypothetical protein
VKDAALKRGGASEPVVAGNDGLENMDILNGAAG